MTHYTPAASTRLPRPSVVRGAFNTLELEADDGAQFTVLRDRLGLVSKQLGDMLSLPRAEGGGASVVHVLGVPSPAVAFFAEFCNDYSIHTADALDRHYYDHPPALSDQSDSVLEGVIRLRDLYELGPAFFKAVIRRIELDCKNLVEQRAVAHKLFLLAAIVNYPPVVARYSTFLLSDYHQLELEHVERQWWTRALRDHAPGLYDELRWMICLWHRDYDKFVRACTVEDFSFADECIGYCPTFKEFKCPEAFYVNQVVNLLNVAYLYPHCVCLEVFQAAIKLHNTRDTEMCDTCVMRLADAILRQWDWNMQPSSWRMGNLSNAQDLRDHVVFEEFAAQDRAKH